MAADKVNPKAGEMDYPAHQRNYSGFLRVLKWSSVVTAIATALVILIISN